MNAQKQIQLYDALKRIASYMQPETLKANSEKLYGIGSEEAVTMAYENIIADAKSAIKGMRRPTP